MQVDEIEVSLLGFVKLKFTRNEIELTLTSVLQEMQAITRQLDERDRYILREIMRSPDGTCVSDVLPGFQRESSEHMTLRKLRDAQFVRPSASGPWDANTMIQVKPFDRLMWEKVGEQRLFQRED
jgi:hypothetical protein